MSEPQPTTDPRKPAAKAWRWQPPARAEVAVNGVLTGLLLVAGLAFGGIDPPDELPAPPVKADPVRVEPLISSHRSDCGIPQATLDTLVPNPEHHQSTGGDTCRWSTADDEKARRLGVSITLVTDAQQTAIAGPGTTPTTIAMAAFATNATQRRKEKLKALSGLGHEARAFYAPRNGFGGGGSVLVRARNAVVKVTYGSGDIGKQLPEKIAMDGALRAATDVVRGLGVAVNQPPVITDINEAAAPIRQPFKPCEMVSRDTLEKLIEEGVKNRGRTDDDNAENDRKVDTCKWETSVAGNYIYYLKVSLTTHPSVESARSDYLKKHLEARAEEPISKDDEKYFVAIARLGEQAYASFVEEGLPGGVTFRIRDVVATVVYSQEIIENAPPGDSKPLTREQSVNGAYAAAKDLANALRN